MELRELRVFVAVVDAGSLSGAARALHAGQSTVSETVQALERAVGRPLLLRGRGGVTPTARGHRLAEGARVLLEQHDRLLSELRAETGSSPVRLGVPLEFPGARLAAVLGAFGRHPDGGEVVVEHAASAQQWAALRARRLDVALVRELEADPEVDAVLAAREPMGVLVSADLDVPVVHGGVELASLAGQRWLGFPRSESPSWWDQVAATLRAHGVGVDDRPAEVGSTPVEVKLASVAAGRVFALAPAPTDRHLPDGVAWRPLLQAPLVRRTWAAWWAGSTRRDVAALVALLDLDTAAVGR